MEVNKMAVVIATLTVFTCKFSALYITQERQDCTNYSLKHFFIDNSNTHNSGWCWCYYILTNHPIAAIQYS